MARLPMACRLSGLSPKFTASAIVVAGVIWFGAAISAQQPASPSPSGLGRAPTRAELQAWDISIGPDGSELPSGSGNSTQGSLIFAQRGCATCHGPTGTEGPAPVLVGRKSLPSDNYFPIQYFPFAPMIWDYIRRAMPYDRPGHLTVDESYALTAFLLYRNGIIQEADVMDAKSLPKVQMPHRAEYREPPPWKPGTPRGFKIPE